MEPTDSITRQIASQLKAMNEAAVQEITADNPMAQLYSLAEETENNYGCLPRQFKHSFEYITIKVPEENLDVFSGSDEYNSDVDRDNLCRICAKHSEDQVGIFGEEGLALQLKHKISICLPIQVSRDDCMPLSLCRSCIYRLEESYELSTLSQRSQLFLQNKLIEKERANSPEIPLNNDDYESNSEPPSPPLCEPTPEPPLPKRKFNCEGCKVGYDTFKEISEHCTTVHSLSMCDICFGIFSSKVTLHKHKSKGHLFTKTIRNFYSKDNEKPSLPAVAQVQHHVCNTCWRVFKTIDQFKCHITKSCIKQLVPTFKPKLYAGKNATKSILKPNLQGTEDQTNNEVSLIKKAKFILNKPPVTRCRKQCLVCDLAFEPNKIVSHYYIAHSQNVCTVCLNYFGTPLEVLKHCTKTHRIFLSNMDVDCKICDFCKKKFISKQKLKKHILNQHLITVKLGQIYKRPNVPKKKTVQVLHCKACALRFIGIEKYREHVATCDHAKKDFICLVCGKKCLNQRLLVTHKFKAHQIQPLYGKSGMRTLKVRLKKRNKVVIS